MSERLHIVDGGDALADLIRTRMSSILDSPAAGGRQGRGAGKGESEGKGKGGAGLRRAAKAQACCRRGKRREARRCRTCGGTAEVWPRRPAIEALHGAAAAGRPEGQFD